MGEIGGHLVRLRTVFEFFNVALFLIICDDAASGSLSVNIALIFIRWISINYILINAIFGTASSVLVCFAFRKDWFFNDERRETLLLLYGKGRALVKLAHGGRLDWRQLAIWWGQESRIRPRCIYDYWLRNVVQERSCEVKRRFYTHVCGEIASWVGIEGQSFFNLKATIGLVPYPDILVLMSILHFLELFTFLSHLLNPCKSLFTLSNLLQLLRAQWLGILGWLGYLKDFANGWVS